MSNDADTDDRAAYPAGNAFMILDRRNGRIA